VKLGMGSALDTFCGQSYGARQYNMLGTHTQRAIIVLMLMGVPLAFILAFTGQILISLGQNPEISSEAGLYAQWLIPGLFAYGLLQCLTRFLQTQNIVQILVVCSGLTLLLHKFTLCYAGSWFKLLALVTKVQLWRSQYLIGSMWHC